jgi:hypothetical protein
MPRESQRRIYFVWRLNIFNDSMETELQTSGRWQTKLGYFILGFIVGGALVTSFGLIMTEEEITMPAPPIVGDTKGCNILQCHPDPEHVTCGIPEGDKICTAQFTIGDACARYIQCGEVNGQCGVASGKDKFDQCYACLKICTEEEGKNIVGCQYKCMPELKKE